MASITDAAKAVGINRNTLARWVAGGKLKGKPALVGRKPVVLVSVAAVRKLVGAGIRAGRPKKGKG